MRVFANGIGPPAETSRLPRWGTVLSYAVTVPLRMAELLHISMELCKSIHETARILNKRILDNQGYTA
jgi:hypothetical protein